MNGSGDADAGSREARSPIFVVGMGRSGTTLLRLMLCAHPRIYVAHESMFYQSLPLLRRTQMRSALGRYFSTRAFGWLGIDPKRILSGLPDPLPPERMGEAYTAVMREKAAQYGRQRFGDKIAPAGFFLRRIFRDFPDARVVRIVRDPRATAASLTVVPFGSPSIVVNALPVRSDWRFASKFRDRVLTVRLEDLLADTRSVMERILTFVGEPWDDAVLDHTRHVAHLNDMPPHPWLESAARDRAPSAEKWRTFPSVQVRLVEWLTRGLMREGGYERASFDKEPGRLAMWREFLHQLRGMWRGLSVLVRTGVSLSRHGESEASDAAFRRLNPESWVRYPALHGRLWPEPPRSTDVANRANARPELSPP